MEDSKIIELYFARDEAALFETAQKYSPYCKVIARNILQNEQDEEEALADTWLCAWNSIPPTKPHCLKIFLGKITRNLSLNLLRGKNTQKRRAFFEPLEELSECLPEKGNTESAFEAKELGEFLDGFLRKLPKTERLLFLRRYWYGDSLKAAADFCGVSETKAKNVLSKLRKKLKAELTKEGYFYE